MRKRFAHSERASWRQRFIAIARQAEAMEAVAPRRPVAGLVRTRIRVRFAAIASH